MDCIICLETVSADETIDDDKISFDCSHGQFFHEKCLLPWAVMYGTCPVCRKLLKACYSDKMSWRDIAVLFVVTYILWCMYNHEDMD